jgi:hypothetical protein
MGGVIRTDLPNAMVSKESVSPGARSRLRAMLFRSPSVLTRLGLLFPFALVSAFADCSSPANAIVAENCLTGSPSTEWDISGSGDPTIQGFATNISVNGGSTVSFKIKTDARNYQIVIYRMGYYGGAGARQVATIQPSVPLPQSQPVCLTDASTGLIDCGNWAVSASWAVPATATSGIYFARLTRTDTNTGGASHIVFIVRKDSSHSDILFQTSDETWQAYNDYGGHSLYGDSGEFAIANRAMKVSYNRPFNTRNFESSSWVFYSEYPMVRWLEANGFDVSYFTGVDTDRNGSLITNHKIFLSVGHDEYWSGQQRANVENARNAGVHLGFFSGNGVFWKTRWENSIDGSGTPYRTLVCYKETYTGSATDPADPPGWTGTWRDPRLSPPADGGRPENSLTGTLFTVNGPGPDNMNLAIKVPADDGKMRFWRNTSIAGQAAGQTANLPTSTLGYEWDEDIDNGSRPAGLWHLSTATYALTTDLLQDYGATYGAGNATHHMTMYRAPSGALVFSAGTVQWSWGLDGSHDTYVFETAITDVRMQQATINLLADMGAQPGSIQAGLVSATKSTDATAPVSTIASPASGATVIPGAITISGSASDAGGVVAAVEVSTDGGQTWHPAQGRSSWTYAWSPKTVGPVTLRSRAVDDSGNLQNAPSSVTVTVGERDCQCSAISSSTAPTQVDSGDANSVELGVKFKTDYDGYITAVRFYKSAANTGTHVGNIWSSSGVLLGTAVFTNETASGWQQVNFTNPVPVSANTTYVASYFAPGGHYSADSGSFASSGIEVPPLHLLANGVSGPNGVFIYSASSAFPTSSFGAANYWVDVVYFPSGSMSNAAPSVLALPTTLSFNGYVGQPNPATQSLKIYNQGSGTLSWNLTKSAAWIGLPSPASGTNLQTLAVGVNTAGLSPGTYSGSITVNAPGSTTGSFVIPVTLTVANVLLSSNFSSQDLEGWVASPLGSGANWSISNQALQFNGAGATQLYAGDTAWTDYDVQATIKLSSLNNYPGGIRGRVNVNTGAGYALWLYPAQGLVRLFAVNAWDVNAGNVQLGQAAATLDNQGFHTFTLSMVGSKIQVIEDGKVLLTVTDSTYSQGLVAVDVDNQPLTVRSVLVSSQTKTAASLNVSLSSMTFSGNWNQANPPSQSLTVSSTSTGSVTLSAVSTAPWLSISSSGSRTNATVQASVNLSGLAPGAYSGSIRLTAPGASNSPRLVSVSLNVAAPPPVMALSSSALSFKGYAGQAAPAPQSVSITNTTYGNFSWTASASAPWITVSPSNGTTPSTLQLSVDPSSLAPGTYNGTVTVTGPGVSNAPQSVAVTFTVSAMLFNVDFSSGTFDGWISSPLGLFSNWSVVNGNLQYNGGGHTQLYAGYSAWADYDLQASVRLTSLSDYPGGIRGRVNPSTGGSYAAWLYPTEGVIKLFRTSEWNIDAGFVQLGQGSVTFDSQNFHAVKLSFRGSQIQVFYDGALVVNATDATYPSGMVALDVSNQPLSVNNVQVTSPSAQASGSLSPLPSNLSFAVTLPGANPAPKSVTVGVNGGGTLAFTAASTSPWLSVSPSGGSNGTTLQVSVDDSNLTPGTYSGSVRLTSLGAGVSPLVVPVTFTVSGAPPVINVSSGGFSFLATSGAPQPAAQAVAISNSGYGTLSWTAISDSPWLYATPSSGAAPSTIGVNVSAGSLAPGTYSGHISISGTGASNSPVSIPVTLSVLAPALNENFSNAAAGWLISPMGNAAGWSVVNGVYSYDGSGFSQSCAGNSFWADYAFDATIRLSNLSNYPGGLRGRVNPSTGAGYAVWLYPASGQAILYRAPQWDVSGPGLIQLAQASLSLNTTASHGLRMAFQGNTVSVYWDGSLLLSATDTAYASGYVCLDADSQPISYSNIQVSVAQGVTPVAVAPASLTFASQGSSPAPQSVAISSPSGNFTWSAKSSAPWLTVTQSSPFSPGSITASVNVAGLSGGSCTGSILVYAPGAANSPLTIPVTLAVKTAALALSRQSLTFFEATNASGPSQNVQISNAGTGALAWTASADSSWIQLGSTAGSAPSPLGVSTSTGALSPGQYSGNITVSSNDAINGPVSLAVALQLGTGLFSDDFSSGTGNWTISPMGNSSGWSVLNGAYAYNAQGASQSWAGSASWTDYTVSANFQLSSLNNYPGGIRGRLNPTTGAGYGVWIYPAQGLLRLYRIGQWDINADLSTLGQSAPLTMDTGLHSIRLVFRGTQISVYYDEVLAIQANDASYTQGAVALDVMNQPIAFSRVRVIGF